MQPYHQSENTYTPQKTEEMLPLLSMQGERILVTGFAPRSRVHGRDPLLHATAVVAALLPEGEIVFADKTQKQRAKGRAPAENIRVIDIFGGHVTEQDLTTADLDQEQGLSFAAFRACGAREFSEELLRRDEDGIYRPYPVDPSRLIPIGFYIMENDHNRELSWAFLYPLARGDLGRCRSVDTLLVQGREESFSQPLLCLSPKEAIRLCQEQALSLPNHDYISDGFSRMVATDSGARLLSCLSRCKH